MTRILSLQTQYGERATIYELVGPALSPMSRASPCDDHIVTSPTCYFTYHPLNILFITHLLSQLLSTCYLNYYLPAISIIAYLCAYRLIGGLTGGFTGGLAGGLTGI